MDTSYSENMKVAQRVTLVGMVLDIILGIAKIFVGLIAFSHALIADGIHSLSDVVTDLFVLAITRISHHGPDEEHPYGHARFEALGTVLLGGTLIVVAAILAYENIEILFRDADTPLPEWPALVVAGFSILSKEWIFHYTRRAGERLRSNLLIANAWHSRTDAFSSVIVLIGVGGAMLGFTWLDAVAAVIVAAIVAKIGGSLVWDSLRELVDTGLTPEETQAMKEVIMSIEGVRGVHDLRSRHMGSDVFLDLHIRVDPSISVSEGHQIGEWATQKLLENFDSIRDLTYHIDVEDDALKSLKPGDPLLPLRSEVIKRLEQCWSEIPMIRQLGKYSLHYLDNRINVELFFTPDPEHGINEDLSGLQSELFQRSKHISWLGEIKVWSGPRALPDADIP